MSCLEERKLTSETIKRTSDVNSAEFRFGSGDTFPYQNKHCRDFLSLRAWCSFERCHQVNRGWLTGPGPGRFPSGCLGRINTTGSSTGTRKSADSTAGLVIRSLK